MSHGAFWNQITIGPNNDTFVLNGGAPSTLTNGVYGSFLEVRNEFMTQAQLVLAGLRSSISATGYFTLDNNGGADFTLGWTDAALGFMFGYTAALGGGLQLHPASRRIGASLYLQNDNGATAATIGEHNVLPGLLHVTQTDSIGGVRRTTRTGVVRDRTSFGIQFLDNTARHVSQSGAVGTTYANAAAASYDVGLTQYEHAKLRWWDSTGVAYQGWSDGRPVRFFEDADDCTFAITAAAWAFGSPVSVYTSWVFDEQVCKDFPGVKARPPKASSYHLTLPAVEYLAP